MQVSIRRSSYGPDCTLPVGLSDWRHGELSQVTRLVPQRRRFVDRVAATVARLADARGWERLLVSGPDRLTGPLVAALPTSLIESVIRDSRTSSSSTRSRLPPPLTNVSRRSTVSARFSSRRRL
jgi:hypothetical protein